MRFFSLFLFFSLHPSYVLADLSTATTRSIFFFFFLIFAMTESIGKCKEPSAADEEKIVIFTDPIFFASTYVFIRTVEKKTYLLKAWPRSSTVALPLRFDILKHFFGRCTQHRPCWFLFLFFFSFLRRLSASEKCQVSR